MSTTTKHYRGRKILSILVAIAAVGLSGCEIASVILQQQTNPNLEPAQPQTSSNNVFSYFVAIASAIAWLIAGFALSALIWRSSKRSGVKGARASTGSLFGGGGRRGGGGLFY